MKWILRQIFERVAGRTSTVLRVVFADRTVWQVLQGEPDVTIVFHTMGAECRTVLLGYVGFFEAYFDGDVDIDGERGVGILMRMAFAGAYHYRANPLLLAKRRYLEWQNNNQDFARAKANAIHHYGLPFEFFRLMLGDDCLYAEIRAITRAGTTAPRGIGVNTTAMFSITTTMPTSRLVASIGVGQRGWIIVSR
jgi:hypothetical protein